MSPFADMALDQLLVDARAGSCKLAIVLAERKFGDGTTTLSSLEKYFGCELSVAKLTELLNLLEPRAPVPKISTVVVGLSRRIDALQD